MVCSVGTPQWMPAGLVVAYKPGRLANQILVDPGNLLHPVQGIIVFDPFHKLVPAVHILGDKFLVVQLLFNDDIVETQGQGRIRARA